MDIIGHQKQWEFLKRSIDSRNISHAYLFHGPNRIGKKKIAMEFAKYINCERKSFDSAQDLRRPCQKCPSCYQIESQVHPDIIFIEPELGKKSISIEQIRNLKEKISSSPLRAEYKIAIIDQAHLMTFEAQSALLKQLEEPKGKKIIILVTEYPDKLLTTIISRCQKIRFWQVPELNYPGDSERKIVWAQRIEEIEKAKKNDLFQRFEYAHWLSKEGDLQEAFEIWLSYFRQLMQNQLNEKKEKSVLWNLSEIRKIINSIEDYQYLLSTTSPNNRLTLELFLLDI